MTKPRMQFSKKIVVAVTTSVTLIVLAAIILMWSNGSVQYMADVIKAYISYAMVIFASYSGNSIAQKIVTAKNFKWFNGYKTQQDKQSNASQQTQIAE